MSQIKAGEKPRESQGGWGLRNHHPSFSFLQQKRDIQLLKAYMRAIRSVNPNLQNLEETIEYNEILE